MVVYLADVARADVVRAEQTIQTDTLEVRLGEIRVEASRIGETPASAPYSVSIRNRSDTEVQTVPALTLDRILFDVPGVWINNRENPAVGERISIRGMGWRAAFGVRGIQMYMDGIPLTMPDGQTATNILDPAFVTGMEVIRGPASSLWGNASGGVIMMRTDRFTGGPGIRFRGMAGSYGMYKSDGETTFRTGPVNLHLWGSHLRHDGYREHSRFITTRAGASAQWLIDERSLLGATVAILSSPTSFNPGSLTLDQADENPRAANPFNVTQNARKMNEQYQAGIRYRYNDERWEVNASGYALQRNLRNPLAFVWIQLDRTAYGLRSVAERRFGSFSAAGGFDVSVQADDRRNWANSGGDRGALRLDQLETVRNAAFFTVLRQEIGILTLSGAVRRDWIRFENDDRFLAGGSDNSGSRNFQAWSPSAGLSADLGTAIVFANLGTSYETPTTTELVNRPDMTGGFNPDLSPERTLSMEAGVRGNLAGNRVRYEITLYTMHVSDRLLPFRTEEGGDRDFFRNEGRSLHRGAELWLAASVWRDVVLSGSYALSNNRFRSAGEQVGGESIKNNRLPGLPDHRFTLRAEGGVAGFRASVQAERVSDFYVNSLNTVRSEAYTVADVRIWHSGFGGERFTVLPFVQVANITDTRYNGSVIINAAANRFFEPAAGRTVQAGVNVIWR